MPYAMESTLIMGVDLELRIVLHIGVVCSHPLADRTAVVFLHRTYPLATLISRVEFRAVVGG